MCGIAGAYNLDGEDMSGKLRIMLHALNHRGQDGAGISMYNGKYMYHHKDLGLVFQVLTPKQMAKACGYSGIGHARYGTTGENNLSNAQPLRAIIHRKAELHTRRKKENGETPQEKDSREIHLVHNGNIPNIEPLRQKLIEQGAEFVTSSDTEVLLKFLTFNYTGKMTETIKLMMEQIEGSYSLLILFEDNLYAVRDRLGNRPLVMGSIGSKGSFAFASETYAFDIIEGRVIRDLEPGEIIRMSRTGMQSIPYTGRPFPRASCIFEWAYLQDSTSSFEGIPVAAARVRAGKLLAKHVPKDRIDVVVGVPETGLYAAQGLAEALGVPLSHAISKNSYAMRTFIDAGDDMAKRNISRMKLRVIADLIKDRRVCIVDDSIVRSNVIRSIIDRLHKSGAKEIHIASATPPLLHPCDLGVALKARKGEFFARDKVTDELKTIERMVAELGVNSLTYLPLEDLCASVGKPMNQFCLNCFNGCHPLARPTL